MLSVNDYYLGALMASRSMRARAGDDRGMDDGVSKLVYIAGAVALALAVVIFAINVFDDNKEDFNDPEIPAIDSDLP